MMVPAESGKQIRAAPASVRRRFFEVNEPPYRGNNADQCPTNKRHPRLRPSTMVRDKNSRRLSFKNLSITGATGLAGRCGSRSRESHCSTPPATSPPPSGSGDIRLDAVQDSEAMRSRSVSNRQIGGLLGPDK